MFALTVNNVAPTVAATNPTVLANEGSTATNTGVFGDVGNDTVTLRASIGIVVPTGDGTWSWSFASTDGPDQSGTVIVTAKDSDGTETSTMFALTVNNVAPTVAATNPTVLVNEGSTVTNTGVFGDVGNDTVTLRASIGSVVPTGDGTWSWSFDSTDGPDQNATVTITAKDSDNAETSTTFALTVNNVAPTVAATNPTVLVNEGSTATNTGVFGDVGNDTVTLRASIGSVVPTGDGTWSWSFDSTDGPDQNATVTITAKDSDHAETSTTFALTVNNVAPTVAATNPTVLVNEGSTATNTGVFGDVGNDTVTLRASIGSVVPTGDGTWSWSFASTDGPDQSGTVIVTAKDSDGTETSTMFALTVNNVAPTVAATNPTVLVNEGSTATNTGVFGDVGNDTVTLRASIGSVVPTGDGTWSWSFASTDGPDQSGTVIVTAKDSDGTETSTTFALTVNNVAPSVSSNHPVVTVDRGQTATNTGSFGDAGNDTVTVAASIGAVTQDHVTKQWTWTFAATATSPATQTVTLTAVDSDGAETQTSFELILNTVDPIVRRALQLDAELRLSSTFSPRANLLGLNEKWLVGVNKQLYYITPTGDLYAWGSGFPHVSTLVATLDPAYHTDPALLYAAATFLDTSPAALPSTLALLDEVYGFKFANERWENWGNRGENWFKDRNNSWYFILPNGEVYAWDGMPRATGEFLVNVGTTVHANPELLWNAYVAPEGEASVTDLLEISAAAATRPSISLDDISPPFPIRIGAWTNPLNILDVNGDGLVSPIDVLVVVNRLNDMERTGISNRLTAVIPALESGTYYDVTNDGFVSPLDALLIINAFNDLPLPNGEAPNNSKLADEGDVINDEAWDKALELYLSEGDESLWDELLLSSN